MAAKKRPRRLAKSTERKKKPKAQKVLKRMAKVRSPAGEGSLEPAWLQAEAPHQGLEDSLQKYDFTVVHTEGTLTRTEWANELHPHPPGFEKLAQKFPSAVGLHFRGRIYDS